MNLSDSKISDNLPDRIKLDRTYDVDSLRKEVQEIVSSLTNQFFIYYSAVPLANNVTLPASHNWEEEPMLKGCSYLQDANSKF